MIAGFAGLAAGLAAVRAGWRPRGLAALGLLAVVVLVVAPPMGTSDTMDYVVYGRMAVLGYDPHVMTPREFRATGDRVGALAPSPWQDLPSVYGPLATGTEWAAAAMSHGSAVSTVCWLKVWNALAFLAAALALLRLAGRDAARRRRRGQGAVRDPRHRSGLVPTPRSAHPDRPRRGRRGRARGELLGGRLGGDPGAGAAHPYPVVEHAVAASRPARRAPAGLARPGAGGRHGLGRHDDGLLPVVRGAGAAAGRARAGLAAGLGATRPRAGRHDRFPAGPRRTVRGRVAAHRAPAVRGARCAAALLVLLVVSAGVSRRSGPAYRAGASSPAS